MNMTIQPSNDVLQIRCLIYSKIILKEYLSMQLWLRGHEFYPCSILSIQLLRGLFMFTNNGRSCISY